MFCSRKDIESWWGEEGKLKKWKIHEKGEKQGGFQQAEPQLALKAICNCPLLVLMALAAEISIPSCSPDDFYFLSEQSHPEESRNLLWTTTTWLSQIRGLGQPQQQHAATGAAELSPALIYPQPWTVASSSASGSTPQRELCCGSRTPSQLAQGEHLTRHPVPHSASRSGHGRLQWPSPSSQPHPLPLSTSIRAHAISH